MNRTRETPPEERCSALERDLAELRVALAQALPLMRPFQHNLTLTPLSQAEAERLRDEWVKQHGRQ
jgi:hypothetical protein